MILKWEKKLPIIPPLLIHNKLESDFKVKANYFNSFLASKSILLVRGSHEPNMFQMPGFPNFFFNDRVILKMVNAVNINKAHGQDAISIRMNKLCSKSVVKPLSMIFKNFIDTGTFPDIRKRMILQYCNNSINNHNTFSLGTRFNKIAY